MYKTKAATFVAIVVRIDRLQDGHLQIGSRTTTGLDTGEG